jgi:hypothetical protein
MAGLAGIAPGWAQGIPMGTMKTTPDRNQSGQTERKGKQTKDEQNKAGEPTYGPNQALAPAPGTPERVTPTYRDTTEDRIMRELTDDGAHDRSDTQR